MLKWLVFCTVVVYAAAQENAGCCTPDQWQGSVGIVTGYTTRFSRGKIFGDGVFLSYDYTGRRLAETVYLPGNRTVGLIFNFKTKMMYRFVESRRKCVSRKLKSATMRRFCIPNNATYLGQFKYGLGVSSLKVNAYAFGVKQYRASVTVTRQCVPVTENVVGRRFFVDFLSAISYGNIKAGISDPGVFNPPSYCEADKMFYEDAKDEEMEMLEYTHHRIMVL